MRVQWLMMLLLSLSACNLFVPDGASMSIDERTECEQDREQCLAPVYKARAKCNAMAGDERNACNAEVDVDSAECLTTYLCKR